MAMSSFHKYLEFYLPFNVCVISRSSSLKIKKTHVEVNWANRHGCNYIFFATEVVYI